MLLRLASDVKRERTSAWQRTDELRFNRIVDLMQRLGLRAKHDDTFRLFGRIDMQSYVNKEEAGILFLAWRCLYAEVVSARIHDHRLRLDTAYARTVRLLISRLQANGQKWYRWFSRTRNISPKKVKLFPLKYYRKRKLLTTNAWAEYKINPTLLAEYAAVKNKT